MALARPAWRPRGSGATAPALDLPARRMAATLRRVVARSHLWLAAASAALASLPWRDVAACLLLVAVAAVLLFPALARGEIGWEGDTKLFYYPLLADVAAALRQGRLPLWEPGIFSGYPLFADGESGMLYPLHLLALRWLAPATALIVLRLVRFSLAGAFTYAFLRVLQAGRTGALAGALVFMLSGFMVAQVVHENLDSGMIWLPLVLLFLERAVCAPFPRRYLFAAFAGVALAMQALAVHVQVLVFTVLAALPYLGWRVLFPDTIRTRLPGRLLIGIGIGAVFGGVSFGLSAVQLLPLLDVAGRAARGHGISVAAATINSVSPFQLLTLLYPHLFKFTRLASGTDGGSILSYWIEWEVAIYIGLPALFLAAIATLVRRDRYTTFFAALAAASLVLALGRYGPRWVILVTQDLLGEHGLRSPGRFAFLWSFGAAALAGLGVDWLDRHRHESGEGGRRQAAVGTARLARLMARLLPAPALRADLWFATVCGVLAGLAAGLLLAARAAGDWLATHPEAARAWLERHYLGFDRSAPLRATVDDAYKGLQAALSPANPETAVWALSIVGGYGLLVAWFVTRHRIPAGASGARQRVALASLRLTTLALIALPLLDLAARSHPVEPVAAIAADSPAAAYLQAQLAPPGFPPDQRPLYRVYTAQPVYLRHTDVEPNQLLPLGIQEALGYSSLTTSTSLAYAWAAETSLGRMLDVWNVRYYLWPNAAQLLPSYELTSFHPQRPLASGSAYNAGAAASFRVPAVLGENVRVIATLRDAWNVPAGATVAWVTATDDQGGEVRWPLRAGIELDEATRTPAVLPSQLGPTADDFPPPHAIFSLKESNGSSTYDVYLYYAKLPLDTPRTIVRLAVQPVPVPGAPEAILRVYGLGVGAPDWTVSNVLWSDRERFVKVFADDQVVVYRNETALPRAYLVPIAVRLPKAEQLKEMAERGFDPERMLLVDAPPDATLEGPSEPRGAGSWAVSPPSPADGNASVLDGSPGNAGSSSPGRPAAGPAASLVSQDALGRTSHSPAGQVTIEYYGGDSVRLAVTATAPCWLFLADAYDPWWHAYVDGAPRPVRLANAMFRAVAVPAGQHAVEFRYEPQPLGRGAAASLGTGAIVLLFTLVAAVRAVRDARRRGAAAPGMAAP